MARFQKARPQQEVRLHKWPPGRVAQLKLLLAHLEQNVNNSLAGQVQQIDKRKFSEFVPIIPVQDFVVDVEFREIRVEFTPPRGLRNFLYYEWQLSQVGNFANFDGFVSPDPHFTFSSLADGATHFIRARVVTKDGLVGPFSQTLEATTPLAKSFQTFDGGVFDARIFTVDEFTEIFRIDHESLGGSVYYTLEYEVRCTRDTNDVGWADLLVRWVVNNNQVGQDMMITTIASSDFDMDVTVPDIVDNMVVTAPYDFVRRGTLVQKVTDFTTGTKTIKLLGRVLPSSTHPTLGDFTFAGGTGDVQYEQPVLFTFRNFSLFEVVTSI